MHEHAWAYRVKQSKLRKQPIVERSCACGILQWYVISEKDWNKGISAENTQKRGAVSVLEPHKKSETI